MRSNQEDTSAFNTFFQSGKFSHSRRVLTGNIALTAKGPLVNFLDPSGATRDCTLPAVEKGRFYVVSNIGTTGIVNVRSATAGLVTSLDPGDMGLMFASDSEWMAIKGWAALGVFTNVMKGLVPPPNSGVPGSLFLRDDGQWGQVQVTGIVDAFKFITDGTTTAVGAGPDTFRLRSSSGKIGVTVTNNQVTFGDNADFTVNEASVNHNALLNYVANQHIDHTAVTLTAGLGISGGGTIAASRTFDFSPNELSVNAVPVLTDYAVMDLAAGGPRTTLWSSINAILNHNSLLNYVADQHVAHSGVSIIAGTGLTGGGDITTSRTLSLSISGLTVDTPAILDSIAFFDVSGGDTNKTTFSVLNGILDHNSLLNYVANEHINHTSVSITGTGNLTGGGTIAASRTLDTVSVPSFAAVIFGGSATPYIQFQPSSGSTKVGQIYQQGDVLALSSTLANWLTINLNSGLATFLGDLTVSGNETVTGTINGVTLDNNAWLTYTPVVTAQTGAITAYTATGRYKRIGKTIFLETDVVITTVGTASGVMSVTLPANAAGNRYAGSSFDYGATNKSGACTINGATVPTTFITTDATGNTFFAAFAKVVSGITYEAA